MFGRSALAGSPRADAWADGRPIAEVQSTSWAEPPAERRRHPRIGFDCPVRWTAGSVDHVGWACDVSEASAGFVARTLSAPRVGQTIELSFELTPHLDWLVHDRAVVERCDEPHPGIHHVGVRFETDETA